MNMNIFDENAKTFLEKILAILDIEASINEEELEDETVCYRIDCKRSDARWLIGRKGQTLEALQFIVRQMCKANNIEQRSFMVDILDYKSRRKENLEELAKTSAISVINGDAESVELMPMSPYERRIIHQFLSLNFPEVKSSSQGEGEDRRIVISYQLEPSLETSETQ